MEPSISPVIFSIALLLSMLLLLETGRRVAIKRRRKEADDQRSGSGTIEGAIFALFGLLVAFTFSGAALRFNEKRMLIVQEANTIETAYLRLQLLPPQEQLKLQELLREYIDSRLKTYPLLPDMKAAEVEMDKSRTLQATIWVHAVAASQERASHRDAGKLLLPALNAMIEIMTTRTVALQVHPPLIIYALLFCLALMCALLAGYRIAGGPRRSWLHILSFVLITVVIVYVVLDIEYPRAGLIRLEKSDQVLVDLRRSMN